MRRPAADQFANYRSIWECKPVLRLVYDDFYDRTAAACRIGRTIEIGGGVGNLKQRLSDVVATDIQFAPWLDMPGMMILPSGSFTSSKVW